MAARRFVDKWLDGGNSPERSAWAMQGPSRKLRKLYKLLNEVDTDIAQARKVNYCPEHAPTACRVRRKVLSELEDRRYEIIGRINNLQNFDEGWEP